MNDEEYFEQLCSNSVDGTLTDSEREKLEAHLAECPSCAALLRDLREMRALFAQEAEAPDSLHDGIMEQLRQETKLHVVQPEKPVRRMPVFTMVGVAAAVVLVVLGGGLMPSFSTVGSGSSDSTAAGESPAVFADSYTAQADAPSDSTENEIAEAAEDAGIRAAGGSTANTAPQRTILRRAAHRRARLRRRRATAALRRSFLCPRAPTAAVSPCRASRADARP